MDSDPIPRGRAHRPHPAHGHGLDRRAGLRQAAADHPAQLGWWAGETPMLADAVLMDVSRVGLLLLADNAPEARSIVLIRLVRPKLTAWVEAEIVAAHRTRHGPYEVRAVFENDPPDAFLKLAIAPAGSEPPAGRGPCSGPV